MSTIEAKDVPRENIFKIGLVQELTSRDRFVIARPRRPFIINRAEALNILGHIVAKADFTVADIEAAINAWQPEYNIFNVRGDELRVMIEPATSARIFSAHMDDFEKDALLAAAEMGLYLFGIEEAKMLCAALVKVMGLKPKEIDAGVITIFDHARNPSGFGETEEDVRKPTPPIIKPVS